MCNLFLITASYGCNIDGVTLHSKLVREDSLTVAALSAKPEGGGRREGDLSAGPTDRSSLVGEAGRRYA